MLKGTQETPAQLWAKLQKQRQQLPIFSAKDKILEAVQKHSNLIIIGETGSGKTTQIPQYLLSLLADKHSKIAVTQNRRVAAMSIAKRVAEEQGCPLGDRVGYSVRFDDKTSPQTRIKYMTDGMLLRELLSDPLLKNYSFILLDEAHERTLRTDILFGMVKAIQLQRPELKIIIMSATLDADKFSAYFPGSQILYVEGRMFPVRALCAAEPVSDYLDGVLVSVFQIHLEQKKQAGDLLVFLTGQEEIETTEKMILDYAKAAPPETLKLLVCPLFANLPSHQQSAVFLPTPVGCRKVILATNIAETSITISGVRFVIDTGLQKMRGFHSKSGMETLTIEPISKASARQRMGRAGREAPGVCYRLYTEETFHSLCENEIPEIRRCNLCSAVLMLKASGVDDILSFDYMDPPPRNALLRALEELYILGALNEKQALTEEGEQMAAFPLDPCLAKILIKSKDFQCTKEAIEIIALLTVESIFFTPNDKREEATEARKKFVSSDGDMLTYWNVYKAFLTTGKDKRWCQANFINHRTMKSVMEVHKQLTDLCTRYGMDPTLSCQSEYENLLRCLMTGLSQNVALMQPDGSYKSLSGNQQVHIHPSSVLFQKKAEAVVFFELVCTTKRYLRKVSRIHPAWLVEMLPKPDAAGR